MGVFRAVLITGPPGIGKTSAAHLCAVAAGYTPVELNASSARSKKLIEAGTNVQNTSLDGWRAGGGATNAAGVAVTDRTCLIMDEVDGMSAGDRGGVGALNVLIKKSRVRLARAYGGHAYLADAGADHLHRERPERAQAQAARRNHFQPPVPSAGRERGPFADHDRPVQVRAASRERGRGLTLRAERR
jgi:DNA polymerase III delta prime subunit